MDTTHTPTPVGWKAELAYMYSWLTQSGHRSGAGQEKYADQRPTS